MFDRIEDVLSLTGTIPTIPRACKCNGQGGEEDGAEHKDSDADGLHDEGE